MVNLFYLSCYFFLEFIDSKSIDRNGLLQRFAGKLNRKFVRLDQIGLLQGGASLGSLDRNWMQVPFVSLTWGFNPSKLNVSF